MANDHGSFSPETLFGQPKYQVRPRGGRQPSSAAADEPEKIFEAGSGTSISLTNIETSGIAFNPTRPITDFKWLYVLVTDGSANNSDWVGGTVLSLALQTVTGTGAILNVGLAQGSSAFVGGNLQFKLQANGTFRFEIEPDTFGDDFDGSTAKLIVWGVN